MSSSSQKDGFYSDVEEDTFGAGFRTYSKPTRGRPKGKPKPLNQEERRMRSTELERIRRHEISNAYQDLKEVFLDADQNDSSGADMTRVDLFVKAINYLKKYGKKIDEIKSENQQLEAEIRQLEEMTK